MLTLSESQRLSWQIHNAAQGKAKKLGACWRCAAESGFIATDKAGLSRRTENSYQMHALCAARIGEEK